MKKSIAIVTGGDSSEEVISVKSADFIINNLDKTKYNGYVVTVRKNQWLVSRGHLPGIPVDKNDFSFRIDGTKIQFDCAYLIVHGPPAENGKMQGYFDMIGIPYIGPKVLQAAITFNKEVCKQYLSGIGIKSAGAFLFLKDEKIDFEKIEKEIGFPCFVKPNESGSSFGVTKADNSSQLVDAVKIAQSEDSSVLIEKYIQGTEVTCGVFAVNGQVNVLPVTEIVSTKDFFDFEAKYTPGAAQEITPARINDELTEKCRELTGKIYRHLNLSGFTRIDYIINNNEFYMLEVNTIPGMSRESIIPKQLNEGKFNVGEVITSLIEQELNLKL